MRLSVVDYFPDDWKITVEVTESGGMDRRGNPLPEVKTTVPGCIIEYGDTVDPADRSQIPRDQPRLYMPLGTKISSTSKVRIPDTEISVAGLYVVDGEVGRTPLGIRIHLRKG